MQHATCNTTHATWLLLRRERMVVLRARRRVGPDQLGDAAECALSVPHLPYQCPLLINSTFVYLIGTVIRIISTSFTHQYRYSDYQYRHSHFRSPNSGWHVFVRSNQLACLALPLPRGTDNVEQTTCKRQHAGDNVQQATCNVQQTTWNRQYAADNMQQATDDMQQATCNRRPTTAHLASSASSSRTDRATTYARL